MKTKVLKRHLLMIMASCMGSMVVFGEGYQLPDKRDSIIIQKVTNNQKHIVQLYTNTS